MKQANTELLYLVCQGTLVKKQSGFNPEQLDIDLRNLDVDGLIAYGGSIENARITDKGVHLLNDMFKGDSKITETDIESMQREYMKGAIL